MKNQACFSRRVVHNCSEGLLRPDKSDSPSMRTNYSWLLEFSQNRGKDRTWCDRWTIHGLFATTELSVVYLQPLNHSWFTVFTTVEPSMIYLQPFNYPWLIYDHWTNHCLFTTIEPPIIYYDRRTTYSLFATYEPPAVYLRPLHHP